MEFLEEDNAFAWTKEACERRRAYREAAPSRVQQKLKALRTRKVETLRRKQIVGDNNKERKELDKASVLEDGWETDRDRAFEEGGYDKLVAGFTRVFHNEKLEDQFLEHYISVCDSRGFDVETVPPPDNYYGWIRPYAVDDKIDKMARDALALYNSKARKNLKFVKVCKANSWFGSYSSQYFITFEAEDTASCSCSTRTYQTRLEYRSLFPRDKVEVFDGFGPFKAFRLKPS